MRKLILSVLLLAVLSFGCPGKHPVDITQPVLATSNTVWDFANKTALALHDTCAIQGDKCPDQIKPIVTNWNQFADLADQIDATFDEVESAWLTLGQIDTPENKAQLETMIRKLNQLFDQVMALIPGLKLSHVTFSNDQLSMEVPYAVK